MFCFIPKQVLDEDRVFSYIQASADLSQENLVLMDYEEFNDDEYYAESQKLIRRKKILMKKQNEILVVKQYGDPLISYYDDYILFETKDMEPNRVELYLAKNANLGFVEMPCKTAILFINDHLKMVNEIYFDIIFVIFFI